MPRAQVGKKAWGKLLKRGLTTTKAQTRTISQLRASIQMLVPDEELGDNGEAVRFIFQVLAYIDELSEQAADYQDIFLELWNIGEGKPLDLEALDDE